MARVELRSARKSFGTAEIIKGVDLAINDGEFVVFVGPSGCGKSTLLRMIAGLEEITSGDIFIGDRVVNTLPPVKRGIAMVFQSYALYPHMSVYDNMAFGLRQAKVDKETVDREVRSAAAILHIEDLLERRPKQLSGGQRQRVAIGRAIVREPQVFLFDEPLSNLDASLRTQMRIELARLHKKLGSTMIYVTHDQVEAMTLADRIIVLNAGRIEQIGTPMELYANPNNRFVAEFIGNPKVNMIRATVKVSTSDRLELRCDDNLLVLPPQPWLPAGRELLFGIRPEHTHSAPVEKAFVRGKVAVVERLGEESLIHMEVSDNATFTSKLASSAPPEVDSQYGVTFPPANMLFFTTDGERLRPEDAVAGR